ncbi:MFS general substrate transporter [Lepidopterella palustris CBS 459.81]|uniref:MFS general substrate transporter n=1 Tax=Lepidopterella palustris CBS 459.81 TaxID=1314670 RepID=A0A8E2JC66_9PEZI|nr:MFS general substrate transporter [Lepidopterella palustris CBS 459.81]
MTSVTSLPASEQEGARTSPEDPEKLEDPEKATLSTDPSETSLPNNKRVEQPTKINWLLTCVGLYLGALLYGLDTTVAATVQASVYEELGNLQKLPWVGIGFPLGSVAVILLIGKLYDTFEIKWLIIGSVTLFEAGSALCGAAPTSNALIVGRVIAGMGGAGMYIGALNYISIFTTSMQRPIYNALIGLCWGTGAILGPVVGGAFSDSSAKWRWAFYINLPLAAVVSPLYFLNFPRYNPQPEHTALEKFKQIDWLGAFLNASTFVLFILILSFQGPIWRWAAPGSIVLWVLFGLSLISYGLQQTFSILTSPERRLFPIDFLARRTLLLMFFATSSAAAATSVTLYYVPLFFQFTKGDNALEACVRLLPFIVPFVFFVMFSGGLLPVVERYAPWYFPAGVLMIVGGALMYKVSPNTYTAAIYGFEILIAIGTGLVFQTGYAVVAAKVPAHRVAASIGFINIAQIGSICITLAIAGSIFGNLGFVKLEHVLTGYGFTDSELRSALAGSFSPVFQHGDARARKLAIEAVVSTMGTSFALVFVAGAVTLVSAFCMRWEKLGLQTTAGG